MCVRSGGGVKMKLKIEINMKAFARLQSDGEADAGGKQ
jgi:hypothetical protein